MRVAVLAPMKPPDHPVPSGDRTFVRLILAALARGGHEAALVSRLVTWRRTPEGLDALLAEAEREAARLAALWRTEGAPDAILTYHNYHKAPDLLGPRLAAAFDLPYAIIEASRAPRHADGPWARHFALADAALDRADRVAAVTAYDMPGLAAHLPQRLVHLPPFIDTAPFAGPREEGGAPLVSAAMMREGRKAESLAVLADAFALVRQAVPATRLVVAGDGPARSRLEPLFPPGVFRGALEQAALGRLLRSAEIFMWPAIDEPFGFLFLEAQAAGLAVVGGATRGTVDVVVDGETGILVPPHDAGAIADATLALLADTPRRRAMGEAAARFAARHDLAAGAARVTALLNAAAAHRGCRR
ncbi:glycosyltransferase family 4 protein [Acuticoccus mangrovi]|uniref:Glycosyltransferase family 4 protein n=1 Tax=Acuticoccus mangrovi TaxID=2796142 RepID=A0A934IT21_9HYPH|nr:glycosyltransferase family 4 protein [Acuticoccus mangrovi]MBJ3777159.1 glycosyltransferase family 4 protein [Acuticoccus mangrovi]